jgi:UDP-N-acetylmuramate--alanine ligase
MAVVTNIDQDHMDTYEHDFAKLKSAFVEFLEHLPFYGLAVVCLDDPNVREIVSRLTKPVRTYGFNDGADLRAVNVRAAAGKMHFTAT